MAKENITRSGWNYLSTPDRYEYSKGWFAGNKYDGQKELADWIREYLKTNGYNSSFIDQMSDRELVSYMDEYFVESSNFLGNKTYNLQGSDVLKDLQELQDLENYWGTKPNAPEYDTIYKDASNIINQENSELNKLYDDLLARQTANYQQQMSDLKSSYKDYSRQILSNDYIQNAQLMNTVGSSLSKSRQNALQAGASAGLRLASNVNTLLSTQNQQTAQSLQTSNNLAQMLLNQRQAAAGIRNDYNNALNQNAMNKANLKSGTAERVENYANSRFNTEDAIYQNKLNSWENTLNAKTGSNVFGDAYKTYKSQSTNKYGY